MNFLDFSMEEAEGGPTERPTYDLILVDGMNLLHRAAHSYAELGIVTPDGETIPTGATYGFIRLCQMIWDRYSRSPESQFIVCWDGGYKHRLSLYEGYKAARRERRADEDELEAVQLTLPSQRRALMRILRVAGWKQAVAPDFEADDVMATLSKQHAGKKVAIYTMDQDLHQCVTATTHVISARWGSDQDNIWTPDAVLEKWGVPPERVPEIKAFAGDSSDNIPGCPGCGPGWARKLLASSNPHEVIARAKEGVLAGEYEGKKWKTPSLTAKIQASHEQILVSWELAKVVWDAPVHVDHSPPNWDALKVAFDRLRFHQFMEPSNFKAIQAISEGAHA